MLGPLAGGGRHSAPTRLLHAAVLALALGGTLYQALPTMQSSQRVLASSGSKDSAPIPGQTLLVNQTEAFFLYPRYSTQMAPDSPQTVPAEAAALEPVTREYEVVEGDTVYAIAERFGISPETLVWANDLDDVDFLSIGERLVIPGSSGVLHTVGAGQTLNAISQTHGVGPEAVLAYRPNGLASLDLLPEGRQLLVPGGEDPRRPQPLLSSRGGLRPPSKAIKPGQRLAWPASGPITTYFVPGHAGIDLAPPYGTVVRAAAEGRVVTMERLDSGWGWYLVIDHGGGFSTLYSHLSRFEVGLGEWVAQGQAVGLVGTTGSVTGPNLHFEVWKNGIRVNPLDFLP